MANHKSAKKRIRSNNTKRENNRYHGKTVRNALKQIRTTDNQEEASKALPEVVSRIDKLAKKGVIHKNKAANLKSKLMKKIKPTAFLPISPQ
ncbi:MAG: 30S ribosomal protein S20 [Bacteroidia bacterium]|nr:30S ribosomal protein S20 [Bacteroidia bacterium]